MTKPQRAALDRLLTIGIANLPRINRGNGDMLQTGINTTVLSSLRRDGYIAVSQIFLSGLVTADLRLVPEGPEAPPAPAPAVPAAPLAPTTFAYNLTFTRPDEQDATEYRVGMNVEATIEPEARAILLARLAHLTVRDVELFAVLTEDGDVVYRAGEVQPVDFTQAGSVDHAARLGQALGAAQAYLIMGARASRYAPGQRVEVLWPNHDGEPAYWRWVPAQVRVTREESWSVGPGEVRVAIPAARGLHYTLPTWRLRPVGEEA